MSEPESTVLVLPPLLGTAFAQLTPTTFAAQVRSLKRAPQRHEKRPKPARMKGRMLKAPSKKLPGTYEISLGAVSATITLSKSKHVDAAELQSLETIFPALQLKAFLEAKKITRASAP